MVRAVPRSGCPAHAFASAMANQGSSGWKRCSLMSGGDVVRLGSFQHASVSLECCFLKLYFQLVLKKSLCFEFFFLLLFLSDPFQEELCSWAKIPSWSFCFVLFFNCKELPLNPKTDKVYDLCKLKSSGTCFLYKMYTNLLLCSPRVNGIFTVCLLWIIPGCLKNFRKTFLSCVLLNFVFSVITNRC